MSPIRNTATSVALATSHPDEQQRDPLAALMLDAYRNTIDDEGESLDDALSAIDHYLASILRPHSYVMLDGPDLVAFAFVVVVNDVHYIDPVVVASARKRLGFRDALVRRCLGSLATQGSSKSERPLPMATSRPSSCSSDSASTDTARGPDECGWTHHCGQRQCPPNAVTMPSRRLAGVITERKTWA